MMGYVPDGAPIDETYAQAQARRHEKRRLISIAETRQQLVHIVETKQLRQTVQFGLHRGKSCPAVWAKHRSYAEWVFAQNEIWPGSHEHFKSFQGWILRAKARSACESDDPEEASEAAEIVQATMNSRAIARDDRLYCTYKLEDMANAALARATNASLERGASDAALEEQTVEIERAKAEAAARIAGMLTRHEEEVAGIVARQQRNGKNMQQQRIWAEQERELAEQERFIDDCTKRYQEEGKASYYEARLQVIRRLQERAGLRPKTETTAGKGSATRFPEEVVPKEVAPSETSSGGTGKLHLPPKPKKDPGVDPGGFHLETGLCRIE